MRRPPYGDKALLYPGSRHNQQLQLLLLTPERDCARPDCAHGCRVPGAVRPALKTSKPWPEPRVSAKAAVEKPNVSTTGLVSRGNESLASTPILPHLIGRI